jgi:hypothetical protein
MQEETDPFLYCVGLWIEDVDRQGSSRFSKAERAAEHGGCRQIAPGEADYQELIG